MLYLHGQSEPEGISLVGGEAGMKEHILAEIRSHHKRDRKSLRDVSIVEFGVDHGLGAHSGNGGQWRTTIVATISLDYMKSKPLAIARIDGSNATELLNEFAHALAIRERMN